MGKKTVTTARNLQGALVVQITPENRLAYEVMEELVGFLESDYGAKVTKKADSPFDRRWFLTIDGHKILVDLDEDFGFDITAESPEGEALLTKIGEDLKSQLE
ncbi:MAG: hypothetical protein ACE5FR_05300 [Rhodospirillales bacterium]